LQAAGFSREDVDNSIASMHSADALTLLRAEATTPGGLAVVVDRPPKDEVLGQLLEFKGSQACDNESKQ
jgi:hypothetical protein